MADSELQGLPPFVSPLDPTDLFFINQDNATTPESRQMTAQEIADELQSVFGLGTGAGADTIRTKYIITPSISSNDLVLAIKYIDGNDCTSTNKLTFRVGNTEYDLTAAMSFTKADATNWMNCGSAELAAKNVQFFTYAIGETGASAGLKFGYSRIPFAKTMGDFVNTTTDEKYIAGNWTNFNATDAVTNIGRFQAQLSAAAGHVWSIPTADVINRPIYETEWLNWLPTITGFSANPTGVLYRYKVVGKDVFATNRQTSNGTSNATTWTMTAPFTAMTLTDGLWGAMGGNTVDNGTGSNIPGFVTIATASATINVYKDALGTAWTASNGKRFTIFDLSYPIAA